MKQILLTAFVLSLVCLNTVVKAEEQSPVQDVQIKNSYLTKAHIKTNSKVQVQTITINKSFLVWVTVQKCKDSTTK